MKLISNGDKYHRDYLKRLFKMTTHYFNIYVSSKTYFLFLPGIWPGTYATDICKIFCSRFSMEISSFSCTTKRASPIIPV